MHEGCSKGPCKGTVGNTFPQKGILTNQGIYIMVILETGILNTIHICMCIYICLYGYKGAM